MVIPFELIKRFALIRFYNIANVGFCVDIANSGISVSCQQAIADSVDKVAFAETHSPVKKEGVVAFAGVFGDL